MGAEQASNSNSTGLFLTKRTDSIVRSVHTQLQCNPRYHERLMQSQPPVRSESLWLEDGNIVFQAEGKQFKVYRGLLALQSTVFKDMFAFPQPPSGEELVEGCPIVNISDSAIDVEFVLEEIFLRKCVEA